MNIAKKIVFPLILAGALATSLAHAATETFALDPDHTSVVFSWSHFGFSNPTANFAHVTGNIVLDEQQITRSKVDITIPVDSVDTHVKALTDDFKGKDYFNLAEFPQATFHSTKIVHKGGNEYKVYGDLKIKDIVKPVILDAELTKKGMHPLAKKEAVGFNATTIIKRSQFGMAQYVPLVSDDIIVKISTEALVQ
jgi:polyisoprenoid-binding protein YceI